MLRKCAICSCFGSSGRPCPQTGNVTPGGARLRNLYRPRDYFPSWLFFGPQQEKRW